MRKPVGNRVDNPVGNLVGNPVGNPVESPVGNPVENPAASPGRHETAAPGAAVGEQDLVARRAEPALGRTTMARVEPRAETAGGEAAAAATAAAEGPPSRPGIPPYGRVARPDGVTLEQGDGWTLEVWPARPGARAGPGAAEPDGQPGRDPQGHAVNDGAAAEQASLVSRRPTARRPGRRKAAVPPAVGRARSRVAGWRRECDRKPDGAVPDCGKSHRGWPIGAAATGCATGPSAKGYDLGSKAEGYACALGADGPAPGEQVPSEGTPIAPARRVAERLAARAEAAVRAPWKAAIVFARAAKREARRTARQSGGGAARDLRNDPREERSGACARDEAVVVGLPGDLSLLASSCGPTLVSATRPASSVRVKRPLRDLRNDPRNRPLRDLRNKPPDEHPGLAPRTRRRRLDRRGTCPCPRCSASRRGSTPPGPRPPCGQIGPCAICATTFPTSARGHAPRTRRRRLGPGRK